MAALLTLVTEIVTGLGMLGFRDLDRALDARPAAIVNVTDVEYDRLAAARAAGSHRDAFEVSWRNGVAFARAAEGLRGRPPWWIEWKGNHRPPRYEQIPADLRIDHVYLVSCKYGSNILTNSSPANLFDLRLADRRQQRLDWFTEVAPDAYQHFYVACRDWINANLAAAVSLPRRVGDLTAAGSASGIEPATGQPSARWAARSRRSTTISGSSSPIRRAIASNRAVSWSSVW